MADEKLDNIGNTNLVGTLKAKDVIAGRDGQIWVTDKDGNDVFLAEVDTFQAQMNTTNTKFQAIGSAWEQGVFIVAGATITMSEIVIRDDLMVKRVFDDIKQGYMPMFSIQGKLRRRDGKSERMLFDECIPDGTIDLMNISAGEIIKRQWTFIVNECPTLQDYFTI